MLSGLRLALEPLGVFQRDRLAGNAQRGRAFFDRAGKAGLLAAFVHAGRVFDGPDERGGFPLASCFVRNGKAYALRAVKLLQAVTH